MVRPGFVRQQSGPGCHPGDPVRAAASGHADGEGARRHNTHFWVDPASRVTGSIFTQTLPFGDPPVFQLYVDFERALYESL